MKFILFLGYSGSGKTVAMERLCSFLVERGWRVGALKHVHDPDFTIDTPGKDTWRFARAGASPVVVVSARESAVMKKLGKASPTLSDLRRSFREGRVDYVLVEGFNTKFDKEKRAARILCAKNMKDALALLRVHQGARIFCIAGRVAERAKPGLCSVDGIPLVNFTKDIRRAYEIIGPP